MIVAYVFTRKRVFAEIVGEYFLDWVAAILPNVGKKVRGKGIQLSPKSEQAGVSDLEADNRVAI